MSLTDLRAAYELSASAWADVPDAVFGRLADALLELGGPWQGRSVIDIGAGSGTATRRLVAAGATVFPVDVSAGMLRVAQQHRASLPVVGDALALPFADNSVDAAVLGFVLNHVGTPAQALAEAARVVRPGGRVLASTWSRANEHPIRELVEHGLTAAGYVRPSWYDAVKDTTAPLTDTVHGLLGAAIGLNDVVVSPVEVTVPLTPEQLVAWRLGMAHSAPFTARLSWSARADLMDTLVDRAQGLGPLVCSVLLLSGVSPAAQQSAAARPA